MTILIATGIDPLTRGTNLFEHVSCYFLSIMDISVKPNALCSGQKEGVNTLSYIAELRVVVEKQMIFLVGNKLSRRVEYVL